MTEQRRALTALEVPYAQTNTIACGTGVLAGELDLETLENAFGTLRHEFPALAGRLAAVGDGFELIADTVDESEPFFVTEQRPFAAGDVHLDLVPLQQLSGVLVVTDGDRHQITLGVNHAVADGTHATFLLFYLLHQYTSLVETGEVTPVAPKPLPSSPLETAARLGIEQNSVPTRGFGEIRTAGVMPTTEDLVGDGFDFRRVVVDAETVRGVQRAAKAAGVTMHAVASGVIAVAERGAITDVGADEMVPMGVFSPIDLRARVDPPVGFTEVTNFAGASRVTVDIAATSNPIDIGRQVSAQMRQDIDDGTAHQDLFGETPGDPNASENAVPVRISNLGAMPEPRLPKGLIVADCHTSSHIDMNAVRAVVELAPPGKPIAGLIGTHYHLIGYGGWLSIEIRAIPGSISPATFDVILAGISAQFRVLADSMELEGAVGNAS